VWLHNELFCPGTPCHPIITLSLTQVWDIIVVGGGIAGCAFAHEQGRQGRRTLLIERDLAQPDRIIGELLQPGGYLALKRLGLESCLDGIEAQRVHGYCMFKDGKEAKVAYP